MDNIYLIALCGDLCYMIEILSSVYITCVEFYLQSILVKNVTIVVNKHVVTCTFCERSELFRSQMLLKHTTNGVDYKLCGQL